MNTEFDYRDMPMKLSEVHRWMRERRISVVKVSPRRYALGVRCEVSGVIDTTTSISRPCCSHSECLGIVRDRMTEEARGLVRKGGAS